MAGTQLALQILRPNHATVGSSFRQRSIAATSNIYLTFLPFKDLARKGRRSTYSKLAVGSGSGLVDQYWPRKSTVVVGVERLVDFLYEDLPHVFDDRGIDRTAYEEHVKFSDPLTKHDSLRWYLFYIAFLKILFKPQLQLHWVKQTGPHEITARWTVIMKYILLPWKPELVLTGTSIMGINPETGKFCTHVDLWDSIRENKYFSLEAFWDIFKQTWIYWIYRTPDFGTPNCQILKRMPNYEKTFLAPALLMGPHTDKVRRYAAALPAIEETDSLDRTNQEAVNLRKIKGGIAAIIKFNGKPTEKIVREKDKFLRSCLISDGLKPEIGCFLARYDDSQGTWRFPTRNELLIWLEEFRMD